MVTSGMTVVCYRRISIFKKLTDNGKWKETI